MRLPADTGEWHDGHLKTAVAERERRFERYERKVDFENLPASEDLYAAYLRSDELVENLMLVLHGRRS